MVPGDRNARRAPRSNASAQAILPHLTKYLIISPSVYIESLILLIS